MNDFCAWVRRQRKLLISTRLCVVVAVIFFLTWQTITISAEIAKPVTVSAANAQADFDFMLGVLREAHTGLYRFSPKAELEREFAKQRAKLRKDVSRSELYEVLAQTVCLIKCGHTSLNPDDETGNAFDTARLFPLQVMIENGRLRVKSNDTLDDRIIVPGMEILEINDYKVTDLLKRFASVDSGDGDIETIKWVHIQRGFSMYYWFLVEQPDEFTVKALDAKGLPVKSKLTGVARSELGHSKNPVNSQSLTALAKLNWTAENLAIRFLKDPDIAQLRIRKFDGDDFPRWVEETFKTLHDKGTKALIIDLRANGGGADMYGALLVSYLTDKPFRYFDHINAKTINPSFKSYADWGPEQTKELEKEVTTNLAGGYFVRHKGVTEQSPGKYPFLGKTFVLIDGGTFSTAADFCAVTHHLKRATFIGEETGGGYYGSNSGLITRVTLPQSRFQLRLPMYEYWNAVSSPRLKRRGTPPDYTLATKTETLLRGIDEQVELALKLADSPSP